MGKRIKIEFYLTSGQSIVEAMMYKKRDETVTDEDFEKEIQSIAEEISVDLKEKVTIGHPGVCVFGDTCVVYKHLTAFQMFIEDFEDEDNIFE